MMLGRYYNRDILGKACIHNTKPPSTGGGRNDESQKGKKMQEER